MAKDNAQHPLITLIAVSLAVALIVFVGVPILMAVTVVAFLPHFPVVALFSGWALLVVLVTLVYLAIYWLRDEPEDEDGDEKVVTHVSASMAEQLRRNAGRTGQ